MEDSKENYLWDLRSERVNSIKFSQENGGHRLEFEDLAVTIVLECPWLSWNIHKIKKNIINPLPVFINLTIFVKITIKILPDILTTGLEVIHLTTHLVIFVTFKLSFTHLKLPLSPPPPPTPSFSWSEFYIQIVFLYLIGTAILWREIKKLLFWPAMKKVHLQVIVKYFLLLWVKSFLKILCD